MRNDISVDVISVECEGEESYQCGIEPTPFGALVVHWSTINEKSSKTEVHQKCTFYTSK